MLIATAALALQGCGKKKGAAEEEAPERVSVANVVTDSVTLYKNIPGSIHALDAVDLVARVNGTLRSVNYKEGDIVSKGALLFVIEDTKYRDAVSQASSALASARSAYAYAQSHYAAIEKALRSDAVSQMEARQAKSAMEQARADISSAEAALESARTNLGYCRVYAPFTGRITAAIPSVGAYLNGEASPVTLATIYSDTKVEAWFTIADASFLKSFADNNGRNLTDYGKIPLIFSEKLPHDYFGSLYYLAPDIDESTGTMQLRAKVDNPYGELRQGMFVSVNFPTGTDPRGILVKDAALSTDQLGKYLYTVNDSDKVVYTHVETGQLVNDSMRLVTSGLKGNETYVTEALLKVRPGMKIKPVMTR